MQPFIQQLLQTVFWVMFMFCLKEKEKKTNKQKKSYILKIGTLNASDVRQPTKPAGGASQTCSETETTYINLRKDSQSSIRALLTRKHKSSTITRSILILNAKFRRSKVIKKKMKQKQLVH